MSRLEFKVGLVKSLDNHPEADKLYVLDIDIGESKPRQIVSGLVEHYKKEELDGQKVIVFSNLKVSKNEEC
eukprot:UN02942